MDEPEQFVITFPVYILLLKDESGTILQRSPKNGKVYHVVFTDKNSCQTFLERSEIKECLVGEIPGAKQLAEFLRKPPSRAAGPTIVDGVIFDPLQSKETSKIPLARIYSVDQILRSIE